MAQNLDGRLIEQLEIMLAHRRGREARAILGNIWPESVPAKLRSAFAVLSRRAGLNRLGLQILHPSMAGKRRRTRADVIEYGSCLRNLGLIHEALATFAGLPEDEETLLHLAFCHIQRWDHAVAADLLLEVLRRAPDVRQSRLARLNLVSSLIHLGTYDLAARWLLELKQDCRAHSSQMCLNCLELEARIHFAGRDWARARHVLAEAGKVGGAEPGSTFLLLEKWSALLNLIDGDAVALGEYRKRVRASGQWETLRSVDWEAAKILGDAELAARVYFGTPYPAMRRKIQMSDFGPGLPDFLVVADTRSEQTERKLINGLTGQNMPFTFGSLHYRAVLLLLSDLYQPWTVCRLYDGLFPEKAFDPFESPKKIGQLLAEIRVEISRENIALEMRRSGSGYRLRPLHDGAVIVFDEMKFGSTESLVLHVLRTRFSGRDFTMNEALDVLPLPRKKSAKSLRALVKTKSLSAASQGRASTYRLAG